MMDSKSRAVRALATCGWKVRVDGRELVVYSCLVQLLQIDLKVESGPFETATLFAGLLMGYHVS